MMELNKTPVSERINIAFLGCVNAGKSSVVNAFTEQDVAVVSSIKGTTTDPVKKTMELLPIGPVVIWDTAGFDDNSELGKLRIDKTKDVINKTDIAILVVDSTKGFSSVEDGLIKLFKDKNLPYLIAYNKCDLVDKRLDLKTNEIYVSAKTHENIVELKNKVGELVKKEEKVKYIVADKLNYGDVVVLVMPIDESAPKGRIILPQQLTLRELLDKHCTIVCCQDSELELTLTKLKNKPKLIITDSQVFNKIKDIVPKDIILTSFSILFARYKGDLETLIEGAKKISSLENGSRILISEGCTHHRQCNDIGTTKLPSWLEGNTGKKFDFTFTSGGEFPKDLTPYDLIIHCGGCMLNETEMKNRINIAKKQNVCIVNYGIAIAYFNNILKRALAIFPEISKILEN